jgi:CubicO group peptidase (beta-lactamase class C family)
VIEQVTGQSLEDVAQELVFAQLGMSSSSFVNHAQLTRRTASGHLRALLPALLFAVPYALSFLLVGLIGLLILKIWTGRWRPTWPMVIGALFVAYVLSLLPALALLGRLGGLEFVWEIALCGLPLTIATALFFLAGRAIILKVSPEGRRRQVALAIAWSVLVAAGLCLLAATVARQPIPVAKWPPVPANAGGSVRATAGDMATFLIELSNPEHLSPEMAAQLQTPQITLASDLSWGLGPGIQHSRQGDALWQWGQHIDFQSVMIIYPEHGFGVVVCTNNDLLSPDVAADIAYRALGGKIEPIRRGIHLAYNYRGEE